MESEEALLRSIISSILLTFSNDDIKYIIAPESTCKSLYRAHSPMTHKGVVR